MSLSGDKDFRVLEPLMDIVVDVVSMTVERRPATDLVAMRLARSAGELQMIVESEDRRLQRRGSRSPRRRTWRQKTWVAVAFSQKIRSASMTGLVSGNAKSGRCTTASHTTGWIVCGCGARAELDNDFRARQSGFLEQRLVADVKPVRLDTNRRTARASPASTTGWT